MPTTPKPLDDEAPPPPRPARPPWKRLLRVAGLTVLAGTLVIVLVLLTMESTFIYPRGGDPMPASQADDGTPDADGYFRVATADGLTVQARWWDADTPDAPVILWFHGNAGTIVDREGMAREILRYTGCRLLQAEYRGYAGNPGSPSDDGFAEDARAYLAWLRDVQTVLPERLVVFGRSLGGSTAIRLAAEMADAPPAGLWIESTFTSVPAKVRDAVPFIPGLHLLVRNKHDSLSRMPAITCPVLSLHGESDSIVPFSMQQELLDALPAGTRTTVHTFPGLDHNDLPWRAHAEYWRAIRAWLRSLPLDHDPPPTTGTQTEPA